MDELDTSLAEDQQAAGPRNGPANWRIFDSNDPFYGSSYGRSFPGAYSGYPDPTIKRLGVVAAVVAVIVVLGAAVFWSKISRERTELQAQVDRLSQSVASLTPVPDALTGSSVLPGISTEPPAGAVPPVDVPEPAFMIPLTVYSDPPGADVWIDGDFAGFTPLPDHLVEARAHTIRVVKDGYTAQIQQMALRPGDDPEVVFIRLKSAADERAETAGLAPPSPRRQRPAQRSPIPAEDDSAAGEDTLSVASGTIHVASAPQRAEVRVSGRYVGRTPLDLNNLGPGVYSISVSNEGYYRWDSRVRVEADQTVTIDAQLRRR
ncbi:MAG TPA: PEGA domain-containing protein [Rhodothermales bacterium]|nr:PEGA domain-containing protein [Rhodothermales bacterium]